MTQHLNHHYPEQKVTNAVLLMRVLIYCTPLHTHERGLPFSHKPQIRPLAYAYEKNKIAFCRIPV